MAYAKLRAPMFALAIVIAMLQCAPALASALTPNWRTSIRDSHQVAAAASAPKASDTVARYAIAPGAAHVERKQRREQSDLLVRRRRQYVEVFATGAGILMLMIIAARSFQQRDAVGVGLAALGALGIGALLQFSATSGVAKLMWPSPYWWLGTFAGTFTLAVLLAAVAAVLMHRGLLRGVVAILIAEGVWWSVTQPSTSVDWLVFAGTAAGALAAPAAAWALASLCSMLADRIVPART